MSRFREEIKLVPKAAWAAATVLCVAIPMSVFVVVLLNLGLSPRLFREIPAFVVGLGISVTLYIYILLIGYIAADARRRGMRVIPWVLLATFAPSAIGIILYFILRAPLQRGCHQCGASTMPGFSFCPSCGAALTKACPSCRSAVESDWVHCAKCGTRLQPA